MKLTEEQNIFLKNKLQALKKSKFRSKFHLSEKDKFYINQKGLYTIEEHVKDFIRLRLAPQKIKNDGRQTPLKGHPAFIAQHATATCCRNCLYKWHHIKKDRELTEKEQKFIVALILEWIKEEM